jgi:hypothetical protein
MGMLRRVIAFALSDGVPVRALVMALLIGTILNAINQGDVLLHGGPVNWIKLGLTYLTPYLVSTHGAVAVRLRGAMRE